MELPTLLRIKGVGSIDLEGFTGSSKVIVGGRPEHVIIFDAETGKALTHGI